MFWSGCKELARCAGAKYALPLRGITRCNRGRYLPVPTKKPHFPEPSAA